jgi:hypothetical protein
MMSPPQTKDRNFDIFENCNKSLNWFWLQADFHIGTKGKQC